MSDMPIVHPLAVCTPLGDRVVLRTEAPGQRSSGGILLPSSVLKQSIPQFGQVVAVGLAVKDPGIRKDAWVLFSRYAGAFLDEPGAAQPEDYGILREEDVLAVVPTEALAAYRAGRATAAAL
jgi:co-chaperonin GroES (HSP10)